MKKTLIIVNIALAVVLVVTCFGIISTNEFRQLVGLRQSATQVAAVGFQTTSLRDTMYIPPSSPEPSEPDDYFALTGILELPISGASGYASIPLDVFEGPSWDAPIITIFEPGQGFTILGESELWWEIEIGQVRGWVEHTYCLINLPDVVPSIAYNITNASASIMQSSGYYIPNITGLALYDAYGYNARFGENQYVVPVLYSTAKRICQAQHAALADGNTLIIYEAFRPYEVQQRVYTNLTSLANTNPMVAAGVSVTPWSISWFIASGVSNHQVGFAIDVSLGRVLEQEYVVLENYLYPKTVFWEEYEMPTQIHELSAASAAFTSPISADSTTAWQSAVLAPSMNEAAVSLQHYCIGVGLTPIGSEWWHFNDNASRVDVEPMGGNGRYFVSETYSVPPGDWMTARSAL
ncbi:MAG: D-alanyl-D-alanine carboxypeptidase family protein [Coriobacteriia bacterium]|nr:D-alanyl-D-alanine carboxypeptidase family protein [Coriobacteriia bacterium]